MRITKTSTIHIGRIIQNAVLFNLMNWNGNMMNAASILQNVADLFTILRECDIEYVDSIDPEKSGKLADQIMAESGIRGIL